MELSDLEQLFSDQWTVSVDTCYNPLEQDDLRQVTFFNTWDDVQNEVSRAQEEHREQGIRQEFGMLKPGLIQLRTFVDFFTERLGPALDISIFWGLTRLIIKVAQDEEGAVPRIPRMLRELLRKVDVLNGYCGPKSDLPPRVRQASFEIGQSLLSFFSETIVFMRNDLFFSTTADNEWKRFEGQYSATTREIDNLLLRIEKSFPLALQSEIPGENSRIHAHGNSSEEYARLPCVILPTTRISRFFDRDDILHKIDDHFRKDSNAESFQSLALYGLGGVGKSSVASKYANMKLRRDELDAMFWVQSEKLVSIRQSFTDIAMRLKLPDARPKDHDENRALVLDWLRNTRCRWMIVYDNAENIEMLRDYWPVAGRGQVLITTRDYSFAFELADGGLEVNTWDDETGTRFLLHLLSTDISSQLNENEAASAHELAQKLSGHALAISHMAGLIHRRSWSINEFMEIYRRHPSEMHGVSKNRSINALWDFAFRSLDPRSSALLGVFCFLYPDSIPQSLFELKSVSDFPESLAFCVDPFDLYEAIENLLTLALIKRDKESRTFSLHRLVQTSFKYFLTSSQRQKSFNDATILVSHAFPRRDSNVAQLYLMWDRCALYLKHVLALKDCFREEKKSDTGFSALKVYCDLNNACQRYLLEINAFTELEDLIQVNTMALDTLPKEDQAIGLRSSLTSHTGQLLIRLGKPAEGVDWLKKSYEIRSHDVPFNPRESAWAAENAANGIATLNDFATAIEWYERSRDLWLQWSNNQTIHTGSWPACIKKSMGMTLIWAGELERARDILNKAIEQIESTHPYNWAMAAYTHFAIGSLERHKCNLESAEAHFMEAQNLWLKGDQLRTDPFNAACMYRLGCTALDQGKLETAIKHFRDATVVTGMRKSNMVAEHARTIFKLSEALEQEPRSVQEAIRLREEAERLLHLRDPGAKEAGLESTYDRLVNILWR